MTTICKLEMLFLRLISHVSTVPNYTFMMSLNNIRGVARTPSSMQDGELCNNKAFNYSCKALYRRCLRVCGRPLNIIILIHFPKLLVLVLKLSETKIFEKHNTTLLLNSFNFLEENQIRCTLTLFSTVGLSHVK